MKALLSVILFILCSACTPVPEQLSEALAKRNYEKIKQLQDESEYQLIKLSNGDTAMHYALKQKDKALLEFLLASEHSRLMLNAYDAQGRTPLLLSAHLKLDKALIKLLVEAGADLYQAHKGYYILDYARDIKDQDLSDFLYKHLLNSYSASTKHRDAIKYAAKGDLKSFKHVASYDLYLNYQGGKSGNSILGSAVLGGNIEIVRWLLMQGVDVNLGDEQQVSPLLTAIIRAEFDIIKLLLDAKVDLSLRDAYGFTALHQVAIHNDPSVDLKMLELASALIKAGIDINAVENTHRSALFIALAGKKLNLAQLLIEAKADLAIIDELGNSLLTHAVRYGNVDVVEFLLPYQPDLSIKGEGGLTALELAQQNPNKRDAEQMQKIEKLLYQFH